MRKRLHLELTLTRTRVETKTARYKEHMTDTNRRLKSETIPRMVALDCSGKTRKRNKRK